MMMTWNLDLADLPLSLSYLFVSSFFVFAVPGAAAVRAEFALGLPVSHGASLVLRQTRHAMHARQSPATDHIEPAARTAEAVQRAKPRYILAHSITYRTLVGGH